MKYFNSQSVKSKFPIILFLFLFLFLFLPLGALLSWR